jgi:hypothetical protein
MKKILILTILILFSYTVKAQFFNESVRWKEASVQVYPIEQILSFTEYTIKGKTEVEGKEYFNLYCNGSLSYYIRETEDQKVYIYYPKREKEFLVYDFDFVEGKEIHYESFRTYNNNHSLKINKVGFENLLDAKNYEYACASSNFFTSTTLKIIKGIGCTNGFFYYMRDHILSRMPILYEFYRDDVLIYQYPQKYPLEIKNREKNNLVTVYSQPSKDLVNFIFKTEDTNRLIIYNLQGSFIKSYDIKNRSTLKIKNEFNSGIYLYKIECKNNRVLTGKFIITR